jgi:hypothetical protein
VFFIAQGVPGAGRRALNADEADIVFGSAAYACYPA